MARAVPTSASISSFDAPRFQSLAQINASRYLIVPCEAEGCSDLAIIWDRLEEQVIDVISAAASSVYSEEDALWDEARSFDPRADYDYDTDYRMAA